MRKYLSLLLALVMLVCTTVPALVMSEGEPAAVEAADTAAEEEAARRAAEEEAARRAAEEEAARRAAEEEAARRAAEEEAARRAAEEEAARRAAEEAAAAEEKPAEEKPAEEKPAEEEPAEEKPAEEEPAEEKPAEEEPAEEKPAEEEPAEEKPAEEKPAEETPAAETKTFTKGYALAKKGAKLYTGASLNKKLGTLDADTVVYAAELSADETAVSVLFAADGEVKTAWMHAEDAAPLTDAETEAYEKETPDAEQGEIRLLNAAFTPAEAPAGEPAEEQAEDPENPEEPAGEAEEAAEEEPSEEELSEEEPEAADPEDGDETAKEGELWSDAVTVTEAYMSAGKTVKITFTVVKPAESYKVYNVTTGKTPVTGITVAKKSGVYTGTATIEGLTNGKEYEFQIIPVKGTKTGKANASTVKVKLLTGWTWKTTAPDLDNPEQNNSGTVELAWTGKDALLKDDAGVSQSVIGWKVLTDDAAAEIEADVTETGWSYTAGGVENGKRKFQVQPYVVQKASVTTKAGDVYELEKTLSGKKSAAMYYTVDEDYASKWYYPVYIFKAQQTGEGKVNIKFKVNNKDTDLFTVSGKPADSYNLYRVTKKTGAMKLVKSGITLNESGIGSAVATGLTESATNRKLYYFTVVPVLNGKEGLPNEQPWVEIPVYKYTWKSTSVPTLKLSQTEDHQVKLTASIPEEIGEGELVIYRGGSEVGASSFSSSKSMTGVDRQVPNGKQSYTVKVRKFYTFSYCRSDGNGGVEYGPKDIPSIASPDAEGQASATGKASAAKTVTVNHMWAKKPTNVHVIEMDNEGLKIAIRFNVKALPDGEYEYSVRDTTKKKDLTVSEMDFYQNGSVQVVTLYIEDTQATGEHTYEVQAKHTGLSHPGIDPESSLINGREEGVKATVTYTVVAKKNVWKSAPNVTKVEQTGENEVTIRWKSNNGAVDKYQIYEYNSTTEKYLKRGEGTGTAPIPRDPDDNGGFEYCVKITKSVTSTDTADGKDHIYVIQPIKGTATGSYSNKKDGTVRVYKKEWSPYKLENDPVRMDHNVTVRIVPSNPFLTAARYTVSGVCLTEDIPGVEASCTGEELAVTFPALAGGEWEFTATAYSGEDAEGLAVSLSVEIPEDYLLAPSVNLFSANLGSLEAFWTTESAFPAELDSGFAVELYNGSGSSVGERIILPGTADYSNWSGLTGGTYTVKITPVLLAGEEITRKGNAGTAEIRVYDASSVSATVAVTTEAPIIQEEPISVTVSVEGPESIYPVTVRLTAAGSDGSQDFYVEVNGPGETAAEINLSVGDWQLSGQITGSWGASDKVIFTNGNPLSVGTKYCVRDGLKFEMVTDYPFEIPDGQGGTITRTVTGMKLLGFANEGEDPDEFSVPGDVGGVPVVVIGEEAFINKSMKTVHLPDSIVLIERAAFKNCANLANMD